MIENQKKKFPTVVDKWQILCYTQCKNTSTRKWNVRILSLFDGISCGYLALERANIEVSEYYAYEIDPQAIQISKNNFPQIIQCGSVIGEDFSKYKDIDILLAGSPCQGFSSSGKGLNFDDPRSQLFFEFVRALREVKPKYFLLENVNMRREWRDIITEYVGVEPYLFNSALVSAQNRQRLYWTNIPNVKIPKNREIKLSDIIEDTSLGSPLYKACIVGRRIDSSGHRDDYNHSVPITQCLEVRATNITKSNCITTVGKDNVLTPLPPGRYIDAFKNKLPFRYYTTTELERLQTLPDGYTRGVPEMARRKAIGNAWTVDMIAHILSGLNQCEETEIKNKVERINLW